jgi:hypothetical protein
MSKELNPEIEFCAFNLAVFLFCFTEVIDNYTSIFQLNNEYSYENFYDLILINDESIPSINNIIYTSISFIQYDQSSIEQNSKLNIIPSNAQTASSNLLSNPNNDENDNITSISTEEFIDSFEPSSDIDEEYDDDELAEQFDLGLDVLLDL